MPREEDDWTGVVKTLGFSDEREMLRHLYYEQGMSISQLSASLGYSYTAIRRRLIVNNIMLRGRGGANNLKRALMGVLAKELMEGKVKDLARKYGVSKATVSEERYRRLEDEPSSDSTDQMVDRVLYSDKMANGSGPLVGEE